MKHFILVIFLFFALAEAGSAQSTEEKTSKKEKKKYTSKAATSLSAGDTLYRERMMKEADSSKGSQSKILKNNRRIYHWKDGQRATPTGHEATGVGGAYSALKKRPLPLAKDTVPPRINKKQ